MILIDENDDELGLFKVDKVVVINGVQYASMKKEDGLIFCKVNKDLDGKTELSDIIDDNEFLMVQDVFDKIGAAN